MSENSNTSNHVLFTKEGFHFIKNEKNNYQLTFELKNNHIILPNIIDFNLVKLIYDLNGDIYENVVLNKINEDEAIMTMLIKHLFEDLGLPQRFSHIHIQKHIETDKITFVSESINERPPNMPPEAEQAPIQNMICTCHIITPHHIQFKCEIIFGNNMSIPPFAEKMVGLIIFKIFNRVKQFIENVRI